MAMNVDAYVDQLRQLLPPGPAWDPEFAPEIDKTLQGIAPELARIDARGDVLLTEMDPTSVREMLTDYERVMALPDECLGESPSFDVRRSAVVQRYSAIGGNTPAYFEALARAMGYPDAKVVEWHAPRFRRARFGRARFGTWKTQFIWTLRLGTPRAGGRRFGATLWGERFGANTNASVECIVRRWAPAHLLVIFEYQ